MTSTVSAEANAGKYRSSVHSTWAWADGVPIRATTQSILVRSDMTCGVWWNGLDSKDRSFGVKVNKAVEGNRRSEIGISLVSHFGSSDIT